MFAFAFLFVGFVVAMEPSHLKPGALTAHLGRVSLVEDVLWVKYPYSPLLRIPDKLSVVTEQLTGLLKQMGTRVPKYIEEDLHRSFLSLLHERVSFLNDTITLALENYLNLEDDRRSKRGLMDGFGKLSRLLFGTAMNEDVVELRTQYQDLASMAAEHAKAINLNCRNIALLHEHVTDLGIYVRRLQYNLNQVLMQLEFSTNMMVINQVLPVLENTVSSLLHTNKLIIDNLVDASRGKVTSSMMPVKDLQYALKFAESEYGLKPLFEFQGIAHYYPLLEAMLTSEEIVIHVPFQSLNVFEAHVIEPFPFSLNGTLMTLDIPHTVVLIARDFSLYSVGTLSDLRKCKTEFLHRYYCPSSLFAFFTIVGGVCEVILTQKDASKALSICPYREVVPQLIFHKTFFSHHYFFFTQPYFISVKCPEGVQYHEVTDHLAVLHTCELRSANLTTFSSVLHKGFSANHTRTIFPLEDFPFVNLTQIKYVTNRISNFTFSNQSQLETAVRNSLPVYLQPAAHYPSLLAPIVLTILVVIPLFWTVWKALVVFRHLRTAIKPGTVASETPL